MSGPSGGSKLPPAPAPTPTPESVDVQALQRGESERRRLQAQRGRRSTILTEAPVAAQRSSILGQVGEA